MTVMTYVKFHATGSNQTFLNVAGNEDSLVLNCDCPKMIPEGSRVFGFAIKSTCLSEDYSDGTEVSKECYRPIIFRIY